MPLTADHARRLAEQLGENQRYIYWLRRRMIEWGFPASDETLALVAKADEVLDELRSKLYFLGYDADANQWR